MEDLTPKQKQVMRHLRRAMMSRAKTEDPLPCLSDIARRMRRSAKTVSEHVSKLQEKGYVYTRRSSQSVQVWPCDVKVCPWCGARSA